MVKLLFVDDDSSVRKANERFFRAYNHNVTLASDGLEALSVLEQDQGIEILFTDYNMPHMDGFLLASTIRADQKYSRYSSIPIIGIGAFPENKRTPALTEYIPKSSPQELLKAITKYCT